MILLIDHINQEWQTSPDPSPHLPVAKPQAGKAFKNTQKIKLNKMKFQNMECVKCMFFVVVVFALD